MGDAKRLIVTVIQARDLLANPEGDGSRSSYCKIEVESHAATTEVKGGTLSPQWNETFQVVLRAANPALTVNVYDKRPDGEDDVLLGFANIALPILDGRPPRDMWQKLAVNDFRAKVSGEVNVKIEYGSVEDAEENADAKGFETVKNAKKKKKDVYAFYVQELEDLRRKESALQSERENLNRKLAEEKENVKRREELLKQANGDDSAKKVLDSIKSLEEKVSSLGDKVRDLEQKLEQKKDEIKELTRTRLQLEEATSRQQAALQTIGRMDSVRRASAYPDAEDQDKQAAKQAVKEAKSAEEEHSHEEEEEEEDEDDMFDDADLSVDLTDVDEETAEQIRRMETAFRHMVLAERKKRRVVQARLELHRASGAVGGGEHEGDEDELRSQLFELQQRLDSAEAGLENAVKRYRKEMKERKKLYNEIQDLKGKIRVYCRVRPISSKETSAGETDQTNFPEEDEILIIDRESGSTKKFEFDRVFAPGTSQESVYEDTRPLVQSVLDGYNVCIFAYGQTGSGKTYTMMGPSENHGVNWRALGDLFSVIGEMEEFDVQVSVSVYEIYNEDIRDLISGKSRLEIGTGKRGGRTFTYVKDLTTNVVSSLEDVISVFKRAETNRSVGVTNMNEYSSRSHLVLAVEVSAVNRTTKNKSSGSLHLIDLAGSERVGKSGVTGQALVEAQNINRSLSALGDVIQALGKKTKHVPFRNSKLTHALADSLGGDSKVLMFVNISPIATSVGETLSSLKFASRVRNVELGKASQHVAGSSGGGGDDTSSTSSSTTTASTPGSGTKPSRSASRVSTSSTPSSGSKRERSTSSAVKPKSTTTTKSKVSPATKPSSASTTTPVRKRTVSKRM